MSPDNALLSNTLYFFIGFFCGAVVIVLMQKLATPKEPTEEEKERADPANWWKYGGNPHEYEDFTNSND
jgi:hypothetical protein